SDLEQEVERALLNLRSAQLQLDDLLSAADPADIATAEADLKTAQESLDDLLAGPDARELAAARSNAAAAWARYNELLAGPSEEELTQLSANLKKVEIALQEAQRAYDKIAWRGNVGETPQAATLQQATIDYESAKAAYEEATAPASTSDLQNALSQAQSAQKQLEELEQGASAAEIAAAEAKVASAQAKLQDLLNGADETDLANARINVEKAQLDLQAAADNLAASQVYAPMDGTVLEVNLEVGQRASAGQTAVVLANTRDLELVVNVAEVDISKVTLDQPASITIDALPGQTFSGVVTQIAPASTSQQGVVNYPVTIHLDDENLEQVRAGMTAVATLSSSDQDAGWLVPANAVRQRGDASLVIVVRDGQPTPVQVTTGAVQGEWIVVKSSELQTGDQVVGSTASFVDQETLPFGPPPDGGGQDRAGQRNPGGNPLRPLTRP
ncbi:MAG: HlyD family efflux transporter periplasmic adaptor subunit, partial [Caldilineae bacterium]